jgi:hypothetical protein
VTDFNNAVQDYINKRIIICNCYVSYCSCRWGWGHVSEVWPLMGLCSSPRWDTSTKRHDGMSLTRKTEKLGEKPVHVPLFPPQIPYGLNWTNCLSHGTTPVNFLLTVLTSFSSLPSGSWTKRLFKCCLKNQDIVSEEQGVTCSKCLCSLQIWTHDAVVPHWQH